MNFREIFGYYSREDVQEALFGFAKNREVVGVFKTGSYSSRPNTLIYPQDVLAMVKSGVIEFHCSVERWSQPMALKSDNYDDLRIGWDLILDLDCKLFEHGKLAVKALLWGLKKHGIKHISLKFTGGTGFHLGIPWESMPREIDYKPTVKQFPDVARQICLYLKYFIHNRLEDLLLKKFSIEELAKQVDKPLGKIFTDSGLNPFEVVEIDPVLISPRHLFRMPYSLHKSTGLVSLPLKPEDLDDFKKDHAKPEHIKIAGFLDRYESKEAEGLIAETVDWWTKKQIEKEKKLKVDMRVTKAIPLGLSPPCIKAILKGIPDGRKRSVFILINYLSSLGWGWNEIENLLNKWNQKNHPALGENYIRTHLRWHKNRKDRILPPNCLNEAYYKGFGVCKPDHYCKKLKNPVSYPFRKLKIKKH
jgi:DNA primase catalytic subunit